MNRMEAIRLIVAYIKSHDLLIHANGAMGRESFACADRGENFYLFGSMGLAGSVGLGIALCRPEREIWVMDGDGNLLMGMGNMALIGALKPKNLVHLVLDNGVYGTTGNQPSLSPLCSLIAVATACGYEKVQEAASPKELSSIMQQRVCFQGPYFIRMRITDSSGYACPRIAYSAEQIAERFRSFILSEPALSGNPKESDHS